MRVQLQVPTRAVRLENRVIVLSIRSTFGPFVRNGGFVRSLARMH